MPIIFHDEIKKVDPLKSEALMRLRRFLDSNEPKLAYFLNNMWSEQQNAITYKQLREWILAGDISIELLQEWEQDYSKFVILYMKPLYDKAIEAGAARMLEKFPEFYYSSAEFVEKYTAMHSARFVTNSTNEQIMAIRQLVRNSANLGDLTVDQLARAIRPTVGLTRQQARAYANYHANLIDNGVAPEKALDNALKYRARLHRQRGYTIARTELAFAHNDGEHRSVKEAQDKGYMGRTIKRWSTADDERVCRICKSLDGVELEMDELYNYPTRLPANTRLHAPAHPRCLFPGNKVIAPDVFGGSIRRFEGVAVTIRTSSGSELTCTANHPILTDRGWIGAGELNKGDKICEAVEVDSVMSALEAENYNMPASIEKIAHSFLMAEGVSASRVPISAEDFHGDGIDGDISIIYTNSLLRGERVPEEVETVHQSKFSGGNVSFREVPFIREGDIDSFGFGDDSFASGGVCSGSEGSFVGIGEFGHSDQVGFAAGPDVELVVSEDVVNGLALNTETPGHSENGISGVISSDDIIPDSSVPASEEVFFVDGGIKKSVGLEESIEGTFVDAELFRDLIDSKSGIVKLTDVVSIEKNFVSDHVYNLHTKSGIYVAENIITHNCRCANVYIEVEPPRYGPRFNVSGVAVEEG